jgi:hypothetical protein
MLAALAATIAVIASQDAGGGRGRAPPPSPGG